MNSTLCRTLRKMLADGFDQYNGVIEQDVYERLGCSNPARAYWVCNWPILHCLGCNERCTPKSIEGFQIVLPTIKSEKKYDLSPYEMVSRKHLLRADEAAFCLNVKPRTVYKMAEEGKLNRHIELPFRVTAESVREQMEKVEI
ncbi:helix-turn-helix domain-containing protein [Desulfovibrio gilichinskyi]|uniref:Uncharacterized protein n=1 Tax=Desulfovibrio gilichinskyi TaxID=1519643 RepID=A0A1X7F3C9_9BACT|nr:helix-turn-helix domain-containing protein [Desulfovibrio gilichinskyi]SMF44588.1 hypothetical protein SAMN06295933_3611 [Desulfovibrio gilichinskyi]